VAHVDFDVFRAAVHEWLVTVPTLDPSLAAAADVLNMALSERQMRDLALDTNDTHGAFGASALLELWRVATTASG
jgi:hypothetical protein